MKFPSLSASILLVALYIAACTGFFPVDAAFAQDHVDYAFMTRWKPRDPYRWFSEGTAAWAEVFVWGRVSRIEKVETLFRDTKLDLYEADYTAAPFWIYFVQHNQGRPNNRLMAKFFEKCEQLQDENLALKEMIKETYGSVDGFLNDFERYRKNVFWSAAGVAPFKSILGPDGKNTIEEVEGVQGAGNGS